MRRSIKAAFYRGGTSKAVVFNGADLPASEAARRDLFLQVLGSPDPYGRQLDGMGGGLSSLSKVVIVERSPRADADVDYTFVQVAVDAPVTAYDAACGNMSSCVGPFAVEEGLVTPEDGEALVRIFNTNTGQIYNARFPVAEGLPVETGALAIPGVSGTGAEVKIDVLSPGGGLTGALLPSGAMRDVLDVEGVGAVEASLIDAANAVVFVAANALGKTASEHPDALDGDADFMSRMEAIRRVGGVAMGLSKTLADVGPATPKIAIFAGPQDFTALDGTAHDMASHDISVRMLSMGKCHRALPLTGAMCAAVSAALPETLLAPFAPSEGPLRIGTPSGVLPVEAQVEGSTAVSATTYRTQRRLMAGEVYYRA
ncbi:PrpF domain-containing protein [Roseobacteraceae bacterium S113]